MYGALGHKLMLAFEGTEPPERIRSWLRDRSVGGFTLFRPLNVESPAQVRQLVGVLQAIAAEKEQLPLVIAADQEGGQFIALGDHTSQFPGNMALGATRDVGLAREVGRAMGLEMAAMGVNVNYAPNCDINTNPDNPAAGIRTFGDEPELVSQLAVAMVEGLQSAGVAATAKHFPGKGDARVDSHFQMPLIDHSRERLAQVELRPFKASIDAGARLIMTGHFAIPSLTGNEDVPATLSRPVMDQLVRQVLGFNGVVITDALDMGAITQGAGQIIDVIAAVRAGVDLLLLNKDPATQERVYAGLQLAHSRGLIGDLHIPQSVERILALKRWLAKQIQPDLSVVGCVDHQQLALKVAQRSITMVRNEENLLPLRLGPQARIAVVMPMPKDLTPADTSSTVVPTLAAKVRAYHSSVDEFVTSHPPMDEEISALREQMVAYDLLIVGTLSASMQPEQATLVKELLACGVPTITVALRTPYDLVAYPQTTTHICTYGILPSSMEALAAALWGKIPFRGQLPVTISDLYSFGHGLRE